MGAAQFQAILQALRQHQLAFDEVTALHGLLATAMQGDECLALIEAAAGRPRGAGAVRHRLPATAA